LVAIYIRSEEKLKNIDTNL
jgi:hypothetical protein